MKICFVSPGYGTWDVLQQKTGNRGGAEAQIAYMALGLASQGHQIYLIYGGAKGPGIRTTTAGVQCIEACAAWQQPASLGRLWQQLAKVKPDLIYARLPDDFLWLLALYAKTHAKTQFVYAIASDAHCNPWHVYTHNSWFHNPLYALGLRTADAVAVQHQGQIAPVMPHIRGRIVAIPNLLRTTADQPRNFDAANIDAIWIAQIHPLKQLNVFLDLVEQLPELQFVVAGGFPENTDPISQRSLQARMDSLQNLNFVGRRDSSRVLQLIEQSKVLVNTSNVEGFPNTMLESWGRGVPVVSLTVDPGQVIQREAIGIVSHSVPQMVLDIQQLVKAPSLNHRMGLAGLAYVRKRHNLDEVILAFEQIGADANTEHDEFRKGAA